MDNHKSTELLDRYLQGKANKKEEALVQYWLLRNTEKDKEEQSGQAYDQVHAEMWRVIYDAINRKKINLWPRIAAAAAILLIVGLSVFFYTTYYAPRHLEGSEATRDLFANDIKPGGNKAYLVLSNGKRVSLTDAANGELAKEAGVEITKTADGQVIYTTRHPEGGTTEGSVNGRSLPGVEMTAMNTIETPRGGQYQIRLPDGSKVWLNAASRLIYPVSFIGRGQREVSLDGEAYFEISKNKLQPFVVKSKNQEVTVLGTHFNINSYSDEPDAKTTLLEGSVKVNDATLKPGEQATLANNQIKVTQVNTELAVAWKNNQFMFESERIENIMRMIARWYNVDIVYVGPTPTDKFGGAISKFQNVSKVLQILEVTGSVHFKIEGKIIYVSK